MCLGVKGVFCLPAQQADREAAQATAPVAEEPSEALPAPPSARHAAEAQAADLEAEVHRLRQEAAEAAEARIALQSELQAAIRQWEEAAAERAAAEAALKASAAAELAAVRAQAQEAVQAKAEVQSQPLSASCSFQQVITCYDTQESMMFISSETTGWIEVHFAKHCSHA